MNRRERRNRKRKAKKGEVVGFSRADKKVKLDQDDEILKFVSNVGNHQNRDQYEEFSRSSTQKNVQRNDNEPTEDDFGETGLDEGSDYGLRRYPPTFFNPMTQASGTNYPRERYDSREMESEEEYFVDETDPQTQDFSDLSQSERKEYIEEKFKKLIGEFSNGKYDGGDVDEQSRVFKLSKIVLENMNDYEKVLGLGESMPFVPLNERVGGGADQPLFENSYYRVRDLHLFLSNLHSQKGVQRNALDAILDGINLFFRSVPKLNIPKSYASLETKCGTITKRIREIPICHHCQSFIFRNLNDPICEECKKLCGRRLSSGAIKWDCVILSHPLPRLIIDYILRDKTFRNEILNLSSNLNYLEWIESRFGRKFKRVLLKESNKMEKCLFVIFTLSADKVSLFKSGIKKSVKPYSCQIDSLPERLRYKFHYIFSFLIVPPQEETGIQVKNPNLAMFLFVIQWFYMRKETLFGDVKIRNILRSTVYDCPEAAEQTMETQHNGECGCFKCRKKGSILPQENDGPPRYEIRDGPGNPKDLFHTFYSLGHFGRDFKRGMKDDPSVSFLIMLYNELDLEFDYKKQNSTDIQHETHNFFVTINKLTLKDKFKEFVDEFVNRMKYLKGGGRRLREMSSCGSWKYRERLAFLLYYFPIFIDIYSKKLPQHDDVQVLANRVREGLSKMKKRKKSTPNEIHEILQLIKGTLFKFSEYKLSMSNHLFLDHSGEDMEETGPQFGKSAEAFESFYSVMRKVSGKTNVAKSIMKIILTLYEVHLTAVSFPKEVRDEFKVLLNKHFDMGILEASFSDPILCKYLTYRIASPLDIRSKNSGISVDDGNLIGFVRNHLKINNLYGIKTFEVVNHPKLKCPIDTIFGSSRVSDNSLILIDMTNDYSFAKRNAVVDTNDIVNSSGLEFSSNFLIASVRNILEVHGLGSDRIARTRSYLVVYDYKVMGIKKNSQTIVVDSRLDKRPHNMKIVEIERVLCHCQLIPEFRDETIQVQQGNSRSSEVNLYNHGVSYVCVMFGY